jgi:hypothetical protein
VIGAVAEQVVDMGRAQELVVAGVEHCLAECEGLVRARQNYSHVEQLVLVWQTLGAPRRSHFAFCEPFLGVAPAVESGPVESDCL